MNECDDDNESHPQSSVMRKDKANYFRRKKIRDLIEEGVWSYMAT